MNSDIRYGDGITIVSVSVTAVVVDLIGLTDEVALSPTRPAAAQQIGGSGLMSSGYRVTAALVIAKDRNGRLHHTYCGDWIPWLNDEQRGHFLRLGLVEEIADESAAVIELHPAPAAADVAVNPDRIGECVEALDRSDLPAEAGAPTARTVLRDAGFRFANDVIAAAVQERKMRAS